MEEKLKPFIEEYSDDFYESIEDIRQYLMKYNKNYREIKNKNGGCLSDTEYVTDEDLERSTGWSLPFNSSSANSDAK